MARVTVHEYLKGATGQQSIEVRAMGGPLNDNISVLVTHQVFLFKDEELVLLLRAARRDDTTYFSVVGADLGKFILVRDNGSSRVLNKQEFSAWREAGSPPQNKRDLTVTTFLQLVRDMASARR